MPTPKPLIGVPTSTRIHEEYGTPQHGTGDKYLRGVSDGAGAIPVLIPAFGEDHDFEAMLDHLDGVMLPGGRANIEPHHYDGPPFPEGEARDPMRDATVLPLVRAAIARGVPIFGICRGIQEINVALGGSLHYRIHEVPGKMDHRMRRDGTIADRFAPRHAITIAKDGVLAKLIDASETVTNSLHGQGIDRLADGLAVEAVAPDGIIEAVRVIGAESFAIGVQWHAEWDFEQHALSRALWRAFGEAARQHHAARTGSHPGSRP